MANKRQKVDWGVLLDQAWGDDTTDERQNSVQPPREDHYVSDGRERKDSQPSNECTSDRDIGSFQFDFSPLLFSQTSTPIRKEATTGEIQLESQVAQFSVRFGGRHALRNCSVDVRKCTIPAGYRDSPHLVEPRSNIMLTNKCKSRSCGEVHVSVCCGKSTPAATQDNTCTACPRTYTCTCNLATCQCRGTPHPGVGISDKTEGGCYSSPLLFSEPCTPVLTSSHSTSSTNHSDKKGKEKCMTYCGISPEHLQENDNLNSPIQCERPVKVHSSLDELSESPVNKVSKICQPNCIPSSCHVKCQCVSSEGVVSCRSVRIVDSPQSHRSPSLVLTKCHLDGGDTIPATQSFPQCNSASLTTPTPASLTTPTSALLTTPTSESTLHFSNLTTTQLPTTPTNQSTHFGSNQFVSSSIRSPPQAVVQTPRKSVLALSSKQNTPRCTCVPALNSTPLLVTNTRPLTESSQNTSLSESRDSTPSTLPSVTCMREGDGKRRRLVLSPCERVPTTGDRQKENRYTCSHQTHT